MKTPLKIGAMFILMMTALWLVPKNVSAQNENVSLQVFYDELGNYGTWIENQDFGYVWVPNVNNDFKPYVTDGHWVFTDYGWTWSSYLPWGWATFHYGRWFWDQEYGNVWVPGTQWGPAWVVWKKTPGYYGWAPMTPGMTTFYSRSNLIPTESWCFVRDRDLMQNDLNHYYVNPMRNRTLLNISSLIISFRYDSRYRYSYIYGPSQLEFQRYYGRPLNPVHIYDSYRPGQSYDRDRYSTYRPQFKIRGNSIFKEARPQSYLRNNERINENENNNYYKHPRENESGNPAGLYNNSSRNRNGDNNSNDARGSDNRNRGNSNYNYNNYNRPATINEPLRSERQGSDNNYNRGTNNNGKDNSNNPNPGNNNYNNRGGSNATGTGNPNNPNTGTLNNYRKIDPTTLRQQPGTNNPTNSGNPGNNNNHGGSNATGTGNTNNPAGTTTPTNTGRGNVNPTPQTNKPATPQTNTPADPNKDKKGTNIPPQKAATDPNQKGDQKGNTPPDEKKDLRSRVQPISI